MRVYLLQYHKSRAKLVVVLSDHTIIHEKLKNRHKHTHITNDKPWTDRALSVARFCPSRHETAVNIAKWYTHDCSQIDKRKIKFSHTNVHQHWILYCFASLGNILKIAIENQMWLVWRTHQLIVCFECFMKQRFEYIFHCFKTSHLKVAGIPQHNPHFVSQDTRNNLKLPKYYEAKLL